MEPVTRVINKALLPVLNIPLLHWAMMEARAAGCTRCICVIDHDKGEQIKSYLTAKTCPDHPDFSPSEEWRAQLEWIARHSECVYQDAPRGLGHAVGCAAAAVRGGGGDARRDDSPFAVVLVDDFIIAKTPFLARMAAHYKDPVRAIIGCVQVPPEHCRRYGMIGLDPTRTPLDTPPKPAMAAASENPSHKNPSGENLSGPALVRDLVEKPAPGTSPGNLAILGRYILPASVFPIIAATKAGKNGEIQLTDALRALIRDGLFALPLAKGEARHDCGHGEGLARAAIAALQWRTDTI